MIGLSDVIYLLVVLGCILISMTLHESMHAFASYWLGDDTAKNQGRLTLNPLAHIDPVTTLILPLTLALFHLPPFGAAKPVPFDPSRVKYGEIGSAIVGAAGPLTNLLLALIAGSLLRVVGHYNGFPYLQISYTLYVFVVVNASFFIFNMIPFPPLDGSRILYAIAPDFVRELMTRIESMGFTAIILFMFIFYTILIDPFTSLINGLTKLVLGF